MEATEKTWTEEIYQQLLAPFEEGEVEFLPGATTRDGASALAMAYIDARCVIRRLNRVVGPQHWQWTWELLPTDGKHLRVQGLLTVLGSTKSDVGEELEQGNDDKALKSAVSDALKRTAVHFGIGLYLYELPQTWQPFDNQKKRWSSPVQLKPSDVRAALVKAGYDVSRDTNASASPNAAPRPQPQPQRDRAPEPQFEVVPEPKPRPRPTPVVERRPESNGNGAAERTQQAVRANETETTADLVTGTYACSAPSCGRALTKGQHEVSLRGFGRPLCPACQKTQTGVRSPQQPA